MSRKIAVRLTEGGVAETDADKIHVTREGVLVLMTSPGDHVVAVYAPGVWAKAEER